MPQTQTPDYMLDMQRSLKTLNKVREHLLKPHYQGSPSGRPCNAIVVNETWYHELKALVNL